MGKMLRNTAREIAVHLAYELSFTDQSVEDLLDSRLTAEAFALLAEAEIRETLDALAEARQASFALLADLGFQVPEAEEDQTACVPSTELTKAQTAAAASPETTKAQATAAASPETTEAQIAVAASPETAEAQTAAVPSVELTEEQRDAIRVLVREAREELQTLPQDGQAGRPLNRESVELLALLDEAEETASLPLLASVKEKFYTLLGEWERRHALYGSPPDARQASYIRQVVRGVSGHGAELDGYIARYAKGWKFARIPLTASAVMRVCMYEVLYMPDIPNRAAIHAAVEIAKHYETPETVRFINGILGSFSRQEAGEQPEGG